jgi:hypothetical protein
MSSLPWEQPGLMPTSYANGARVLLSPWDFSLEFSYQVPQQDETTGEITAARLAGQRITMSPQHFKAMLRIMEENLREYERNFGEVPVIAVPVRPPAEEGETTT